MSSNSNDVKASGALPLWCSASGRSVRSTHHLWCTSGSRGEEYLKLSRNKRLAARIRCFDVGSRAWPHLQKLQRSSHLEGRASASCWVLLGVGVRICFLQQKHEKRVKKASQPATCFSFIHQTQIQSEVNLAWMRHPNEYTPQMFTDLHMATSHQSPTSRR